MDRENKPLDALQDAPVINGPKLTMLYEATVGKVAIRIYALNKESYGQKQIRVGTLPEPHAFLSVLLAIPSSSFDKPAWATFFLERASLFKTNRNDLRSISMHCGNERDY